MEVQTGAALWNDEMRPNAGAAVAEDGPNGPGRAGADGECSGEAVRQQVQNGCWAPWSNSCNRPHANHKYQN